MPTQPVGEVRLWIDQTGGSIDLSVDAPDSKDEFAKAAVDALPGEPDGDTESAIRTTAADLWWEWEEIADDCRRRVLEARDDLQRCVLQGHVPLVIGNLMGPALRYVTIGRGASDPSFLEWVELRSTAVFDTVCMASDLATQALDAIKEHQNALLDRKAVGA